MQKEKTLLSNVISKDKLTAYQRWEMTSFNEELPSHTNSHELPAQTDLEKLQIQAKTEAYAIGYKEGYEQGFEEGEKAGFAEMQSRMQAEIQESILHIEQCGQQFASELANAHDEIGKDFIQLAIELAQAMTKTQIQLNPESINAIVEESISLLPFIHQPAQIFLHPLDAKIVQENLSKKLEPDGWKIVHDQNIERGGCRLETAHNIIDSTVSTRWARLTDQLKSNDVTQQAEQIVQADQNEQIENIEQTNS